MDIVDLIERETNTTYARRGKERHGPCPFCRCAGNQFIIFTTGEPRYWCRGCRQGGDAIQFMRDYKNLSFNEAKEYLGINDYVISNHNNHNNHNNNDYHNNHNYSRDILQPPGDDWLTPAQEFVSRCRADLWGNVGAKARAWLNGRGLSDDTIRLAGLGYNAAESWIDRGLWGLPPEKNKQGKLKDLWLPRGVVIPWMVDGVLWCVRIRRPVTEKGELKYYLLPGSTANTLYNAGSLGLDRPAMIQEGEIDALTVQQHAGDLVAAVATGGTSSARRAKWLARLALASLALVAYDSDEPGDKAAAYWVDALNNAKRWRPYWKDANQMAQDGVNLRAWVAAGLGAEVEADDLDLTSLPGQTVSEETWQAAQDKARRLYGDTCTLDATPIDSGGWHVTRLTVRPALEVAI